MMQNERRIYIGKEEYTMRPVQFLTKSGTFVFAALMVGCAANLPESTGSAPAASRTQFVGQYEARDLAFKYRQQAADLREMARRLDAEVHWLTSQGGPSDEQVRRTRETVRQLSAAADQAEQLARDYRRQVPHGQVN
jgi:hypothetical protein